MSFSAKLRLFRIFLEKISTTFFIFITFFDKAPLGQLGFLDRQMGLLTPPLSIVPHWVLIDLINSSATHFVTFTSQIAGIALFG